MTKPPTVKLTTAQKTALTGAWSYDQAVLFTKDLFNQVGDAWGWMVPQVREALVAQEAFNVIRSQHKETVRVEDMDKLLRAMRVVAGLCSVEEV